AVGDPHRQHLGPPRGHEAQIVSLYYIGNRIYTGGMDAALGIWEVQDAVIGGFSVTLVTMLQEFDASVVSVVADMQLIVCGCSDCGVFVFDAVTFAIVARMITAHERSVMGIAVDSGNNWFTTAGADNRVKVWELGPRSTQTSYRKITLRHCLEPERRGDEFFNGHLHPITCIKQTSSEIVSGDSNGRIVIWNVDADHKLLRICDVHKGGIPVTCLQFDATRVVSGGQDGTICVTDFATGHLLQTLVGHKESILDLQFDRKRLMSMSSDGKLRLWYWQSRIGVGGDRKKYHILGSGETLKALSLKYRTSINQLLQWNGLPDSSHLYLGQKLIVEIDA
uniref:LysM domain-containing protein n=1 Tax=Globisporangium ultimum (strain ATCC 200006 / CBS 805.95 / DAOM BR144) TaxID=431595 RepID=K3WHI4_GLOUD